MARNTRLLEFSRKMLTVQFKQNRVEKTLGLATRGTGSNNDVLIFEMSCTDGMLLMHVQRPVDQRRNKTLHGTRKTLARQFLRFQSGFKAPRLFRKRAFEQAPFLPQGGLKGIPKLRFFEEKKKFSGNFRNVAESSRATFVSRLSQALFNLSSIVTMLT